MRQEMNARRLISTGSPFEIEAGYSRAVVENGMVYVAGTTGYDYSTMAMPSALETQVDNCFATIAKALTEAGSSLEHVVRARYVVTTRRDALEVMPMIGSHLSEIRPAATLIIAGLLDESMRIEIDVTATIARD